MAESNMTTVYNELSDLITTTDLEPSLAAMLLCVALCAAGHSIGIPIIANIYLNSIESVQEKIQWIEYTRNGMYKSLLLCGIPRVINAQIALYTSLPIEYQALLRTSPLIPDENTQFWNPRGKDLFLQIYGDFSKGIAIEHSNPDLWQMVKLMYGIVVSESTYLDYKSTELEVIVSLIQMNALPQLHDHIVGAQRVGATTKQIKAAEYIGHQVKNLLK